MAKPRKRHTDSMVRPATEEEKRYYARSKQRRETENVAQESDSEHSEAHSQQDRRPSSTKRSKKAKRRSSKSRHEDISDSEASREPLGETFYSNKQSQRANQHPNMPKTRNQKCAEKAAAKANRKRDDRDEDLVDSEPESETEVSLAVRKRQKRAAEEAENRRIRLELARYQAREKAQSKVASLPRKKKKETTKGTHSAILSVVKETTKTHFFKIGKFVSNDTQLVKATRKVMEYLDLDEMRGLSGPALIAAEEEWIAKWKDQVRRTLNEWRNYTAGELQKLLKEIMDLDPERKILVPNPEQLAKVILREGLLLKDGMSPDEKAEVEMNQKHFDFYWDRMASKIAGHSSWGAGKRHHGLMSSMRESPDSELFVTPSDEAFTLLVWENNYKRWVWQHKQDELEKKQEEEDAKAKADGDRSGAEDGKKVSDEEEEDESDEEGGKSKKKRTGKKKKGKKKNSEGEEEEEKPHPDSIAPYTITDGGAMPYGGWNKAGRKRYRELLNLITESKKKKRVYEAEVEALARIRKHHQVDERAAKAKKGKKVEEAEEIDSDHEPDWF